MFTKQPSNGKPASGFDPLPPSAPAPEPAPRKPAAKMASLLAGDLVITGDLVSDGEVHVDGVVRGDVKAPRLSIGESGRIDGAVHADVVEVRGYVNGSISAKQVRLLATSHVEGDITHEQLTMETGAHFQGRSLKFQRPAVIAAPPPAPATAEVVSLTPPTPANG